MNIQELSNLIASLDDEKKISLTIADQKVTNRFDTVEPKVGGRDILTDIAYIIYAYVVAAIIFKAQGKEKSKAGLDYFLHEWEQIVSVQKPDILEESKTEKNNAAYILNAFLFTEEKITMSDLLAKFAPLAMLKVMNENPEEEKLVMKTFSKNREVLFNQVLLFTRSVLHSFFNKSGIDALKMRVDFDNLSNGMFSYDNKVVIIPTYENAFTLNSYKRVAIKKLSQLSKNFPSAELKGVCLIYLTKDICAECIVK